jgi:hypothetical protein
LKDNFTGTWFDNLRQEKGDKNDYATSKWRREWNLICGEKGTEPFIQKEKHDGS